MKKIALLSFALLTIFSVMAESQPIAEAPAAVVSLVTEEKLTDYEATIKLVGILQHDLFNHEVLSKEILEKRINQGADVNMLYQGKSLMDIAIDEMEYRDASTEIELLKKVGAKPTVSGLLKHISNLQNPWVSEKKLKVIKEYVKQNIHLPAVYLDHMQQTKADSFIACKKFGREQDEFEKNYLKKKCEEFGAYVVLLNILNNKDENCANEITEITK